MIVGIDLGTTNSLVAYVDNGTVQLVPNSRGLMLTPSVVAAERDGSLQVGESARNRAAVAPDSAAVRIKRRMGERVTVPVGARKLSPEEVSARILQSLRQQAEHHLGCDVRSAVVTVPAHFDDSQRQATFEAALLAGFDHVRLLNEPTAAALPYAARDVEQERILVFDFGGGTLDVTALVRNGTEFVVRSTCGDGQLGGADIDQVLLDYIARDLEAQTGIDPLADGHGRAALEELAERCKIELSERSEATVALPFFGGGSAHPEVTVSRDELEQAILPFVERASALVERAVREAGFSAGFDVLVLAGGSSRLPVIRRALAAQYPVRVASRINPDEVIAAGAALFGATLDEQLDFSLHDVLSGTVAVELADGTSVPLMQRNQTVPARHTRMFAAESGGQQVAEIHLTQGDRRMARDNRSLGRFVLRDLASSQDDRARIAVTIDVTDDGMVRVFARDATGRSRGGLRVRSRPTESDRAIVGSKTDFLASLVRRLQRLSDRVDAELAAEVRDVVALAEGGHLSGQADDAILLLESLIDECLVSIAPIAQPTGGRVGTA